MLQSYLLFDMQNNSDLISGLLNEQFIETNQLFNNKKMQTLCFVEVCICL